MSSDFLVSAIMPCRGRADLTAQALQCFLAQTWPNKELIVIDDSEQPAFPVAPSAPGICYWPEPGRKTVAAKRNLAVGRAHGSVIVHWDSDDYSAPARMKDQVERLATWAAEATGYHSMVFMDQERKKAWKYHGAVDSALGSSLCYRKEFWRKHPFPANLDVGEDGWFVCQTHGKIVSVDAGQMMFARNHSDNTYKREMVDRHRWEPLAWPERAV
jgi:glycosyltransferase involved in cell wall biosynthesis